MEEPLKRRELDFSDYWGMILRRKVLIIGLCLVFAISSAIFSFLLPSVYRGESLVNICTPPSVKPTAGELVSIIGDVDAKKAQIFAGHSDAIDSVKIQEVKAANQIRMVIESGRAELIPQAMKELFDHIQNLEGIQNLQKQYRIHYEKRIQELSTAVARGEELEKKILDPAAGERIVFVGSNAADLLKYFREMKMEKERLEGELEQFRALTRVAGNDEKQAQRIKPDRAKIVAVSAIFGLILGILIAFFVENVHGRSEVR